MRYNTAGNCAGSMVYKEEWVDQFDEIVRKNHKVRSQSLEIRNNLQEIEKILRRLRVPQEDLDEILCKMRNTADAAVDLQADTIEAIAEAITDENSPIVAGIKVASIIAEAMEDRYEVEK